MTRYEEKAIQEAKESRKDLLYMVKIEVRFRHKAGMSASTGGDESQHKIIASQAKTEATECYAMVGSKQKHGRQATLVTDQNKQAWHKNGAEYEYVIELRAGGLKGSQDGQGLDQGHGHERGDIMSDEVQVGNHGGGQCGREVAKGGSDAGTEESNNPGKCTVTSKEAQRILASKK